MKLPINTAKEAFEQGLPLNEAVLLVLDSMIATRSVSMRKPRPREEQLRIAESVCLAGYGLTRENWERNQSSFGTMASQYREHENRNG